MQKSPLSPLSCAPIPWLPTPLFRTPEWEEGMYKVRRILDHRQVRGGGLEYEVEWCGVDKAGNPWPLWWLRSEDITDDLVEGYQAARGQGVPTVHAQFNVSLVYEEVRRKVAQAIMTGSPTKNGFNGANRPRVHKLPLDILCLKDIALPVLEMARKHGGPPIALSRGNKGKPDEWWQLIIESLDRISAFCNFQQFVDFSRCTGNVRLTGNRKHSGDMMAVGMPLVLTVKTVRPGIVSSTLEFPTVHFNGGNGRATYPLMGTGMLKREASRRALVRHVRDALPERHPLCLNGWAALPADVSAVARAYTVYTPPRARR